MKYIRHVDCYDYLFKTQKRREILRMKGLEIKIIINIPGKQLFTIFSMAINDID